MKTLVFALFCCTISCQTSSSKKDREGDNSSARPDETGITPGDWYVAGAKFSNVISADNNVDSVTEIESLPFQGCGFLSVAGVKTFFMNFDDSPESYTGRTLAIVLKTDSIPKSGASWRFDSPSLNQSIKYSDNRVEPARYWGSLGESDSNCSFTVDNVSAPGNTRPIPGGRPGETLSEFFLQGQVHCDKLREGYKENSYLKFDANVGCKGILMNNNSTPELAPKSATDSKGNTWTLVGYRAWKDSAQECTKIGLRLPNENDLLDAAGFLARTDLVTEIHESAPLGSDFIWSSTIAATGGVVEAFIEKSASDKDRLELVMVIGYRPEEVGAVVCFGPK